VLLEVEGAELVELGARRPDGLPVEGAPRTATTPFDVMRELRFDREKLNLNGGGGADRVLRTLDAPPGDQLAWAIDAAPLSERVPKTVGRATLGRITSRRSRTSACRQSQMPRSIGSHPHRCRKGSVSPRLRETEAPWR
jgi:hypothetical protein